jgi:ATP-dependent DNA helicase PIF1
MAKKKFYAVRFGREPGIYLTWDECKAQVHGYKDSVFKGFGTRPEADAFLQQGSPRQDRKRPPGTMAASSPIPDSTAASTPAHTPVRYPKKHAAFQSPESKSAPMYSSFAQRMMDTMGHVDGEGLGKKKQGITSPVKATKPRGQNGVGYGIEKLNAKQFEALELAKSGGNVFLTGPAGTGKSVVIRQIIGYLKQTYKDEEWVAVGPTGPTAIAIGGQTLHSFAGCGVPVLVKDFDKAWKQDKRDQWRRLRTMVLDEVSMISGEFLDNLSNVVCEIRGEKNGKAFGGIQLIICGDFLQLPPIPKRKNDIQEMIKAGKKQEEIHCDRGFGFQAKAWEQAQLRTVELDEVFRQTNETFVRLLHEIRRGKVSTEAGAFLQKCNRPLPHKDGIQPTILYAKNVNVTNENLRELAKLGGEECTFEAIDTVEVLMNGDGEVDDIWAEQRLSGNSFFQQCTAEKSLPLKVGAQVMLIQNERSSNRKRLVNGSRGMVTGFTSEFPDDAIGTQYESAGNKDTIMYPIVTFRNDVEKVIGPVRFTSRLAGLGTCVRTGIPLKLAWAITIHKSQGMTLDYVKADLGGVFTEAQTYVALSRASDENGLELRNFAAHKVRANIRALEFYANPAGSFPCWDEGWRKAAANEKDATVAPPVAIPGCLRGLAFVFTGELGLFPREKADKLVHDCGGVARSAVSGKTDYLVLGNWSEDGRDVTSTAKYIKAKQITEGVNKSNLKIVSQKEFFALITPRIVKKRPDISAFFQSGRSI